MRYPDFSSINGYATEVRDALRRRKHSRKPRVRLRIGDTEPRVLAEDSAAAERLLEVAGRFAGYTPASRGSSNG